MQRKKCLLHSVTALYRYAHAMALAEKVSLRPLPRRFMRASGVVFMQHRHSQRLKQPRRPHARTDAHRDHPPFLFGAAHPMHERGGTYRTRRAQWVA